MNPFLKIFKQSKDNNKELQPYPIQKASKTKKI